MEKVWKIRQRILAFQAMKVKINSAENENTLWKYIVRVLANSQKEIFSNLY